MTDACSTHTQISLSTGVVVPTLYIPRCGSNLTLILAHGLGSSNPKNKNHLKDKWIDLIKDAATGELTVVSYTARGHGTSCGWESTAETNPSQFTWFDLAKDMSAVADHFSARKFLAGGSSMGSATSLYAAIANPERVSGLILIRPPTAWELRQARRKFLLNSADRLKLETEREVNECGVESDTSCGNHYHHVLRGAAYADLPPVDSVAYQQIQHIPTLILTIMDDPAHPVSTAETLHALLPGSVLNVAVDIQAAAREWPALITNFVQRIVLSSSL